MWQSNLFEFRDFIFYPQKLLFCREQNGASTGKTKPTSIFSCLTFSLCVKPRVKSDSRGRYLSLCRRLTFIKQFHRHPTSSSQKSSRHRVLQPSYIRYAVFWPFFHHSLRILVKLCPSSHPLSISVIVTWLRPNLILILFCFCLLK